MKKIFVLLNVLVLCYLVQGQPGRWNRNSTPFEFVWQITDSMNRIPLDTLTNAADGSIAMKNHGLWFKDTIWKKVAYLTDVTGGGGGGGIWGGITGTLSDQGDLQSALDLKLRIADTSGMLSPYARSIGNLSPLFTASIASHGISFSLSNASPYTVLGRGTGTGAPSYISSLDSNWIPGLHTQAYYDARYTQSISGVGGVLTFSNGLQQIGNGVVALPDLAIWNARQFQNFPIESGSPSNGDMWQFKDGQWILVNEADLSTGGGGGGSSITSFINVDTTYRRLATVVDSTNAILKSIRLISGSEIVPTETDSTIEYDLSTLPPPTLDQIFNAYGNFQNLAANDEIGISVNDLMISGTTGNFVVFFTDGTLTSTISATETSAGISSQSSASGRTASLGTGDHTGGGLMSNGMLVGDVDSDPNTVIVNTIFQRTTVAQTPSAGVGESLQFTISNDGGVGSYAVANEIVSQLTSVTAGSETSKFIITGKTTGTLADWLTLGSGGALRLNQYGAGTLTTDGSGNVTATSDIRLKDIQGFYDHGLSDVMQITPIKYRWNKKSGFDMSRDYVGFSAQNIQSVLGDEAVGHTKDGYLTIQDRSIIAALVNAVKEQQKEIELLKKNK